MSLAQHTAAISPSRASPGRLDTRALRRTLGAFPTGVTVVTALARSGHALGITVNSFASVSLDPPLVLWSQARTSPSHDAFVQVETMVINILSQSQREVSARFAQPHPDKFAGIACTHAPCGTPMLAGCAATLVCRVARRYDGGDHTIHLCEVESFQGHDSAPLIFCKGSYLDHPHAAGHA